MLHPSIYLQFIKACVDNSNMSCASFDNTVTNYWVTSKKIPIPHSGYAGYDESGTGAWAGPVVAAVCVIPKGVDIPGVDDSKRLSAESRLRFYKQIIQHTQIRWATCASTTLLLVQDNCYPPQSLIDAFYSQVAIISKTY